MRITSDIDVKTVIHVFVGLSWFSSLKVNLLLLILRNSNSIVLNLVIYTMSLQRATDERNTFVQSG